jgi:hypothetical protein
VHVLGDHQDRRPPSSGRQQLQGRQPYQRHSWCHPVADPQGSEQRIALGAGQRVGFGQQRPQQLVQPGKGKVRLARDTCAGQHPHPAIGRAPGGHLRQRRLPYPGIAQHQQRPAAVADAGQQQLHSADLRIPPEQL